MTDNLDRVPWWQVGRWPVWGLPPRALVVILVTILSALGLTGVSLAQMPLTHAHLATAGLLTALCIVHTELLLGVEQIRRNVSRDRSVITGHNDLSSVWTFATAVLVPPALSASATFVMLTHLWWRCFRPSGNPAYRSLHSRTTSMLACFGVGFVLASSGVDVGAHGVPTFEAFLAILGALLAYLTINTLLVICTAILAVPEATFTSMIGTRDDVALEVATLGLGGALAVLLSSRSPWAACLLLPLLLVMHRTVAIQQMEREAATDEMTGLLNSPAWHRKARRQLAKATRRHQEVCLLLLDLDEFRRINATYGRDAGDAVLALVGPALARGGGEYKLLGRLSGEEFVLLLPEADADEVRRVASRLKTEVKLVSVTRTPPESSTPETIDGLTASVGAARFPTDGQSLEELLHAADQALEVAKRTTPADGFQLGPTATSAMSLEDFHRRRLRDS